MLFLSVGGTITIIVVILLVLLLVAFVIANYNKLVELRNRVKNQWHQIDVQLKRRFDMIPNLAETVRGYAKHEEAIFGEFAKARGLFSIPSGRSGGVIGDVVMDLAVGLKVDFIKNGCPRSGERIDKLNFLMRVSNMHNGCRMSDISSKVKF